MATIEERLTQVENDLKLFKAQTIKAYQDLTVPFAIVRGLTESAVGQLAVVRATQEEHTKRLEAINAHLNSLQEHTNRIDKRLETFEQNVNSRFEAQDKKLDQVLLLLTPKSE